MKRKTRIRIQQNHCNFTEIFSSEISLFLYFSTNEFVAILLYTRMSLRDITKLNAYLSIVENDEFVIRNSRNINVTRLCYNYYISRHLAFNNEANLSIYMFAAVKKYIHFFFL